MHLFKKIKNRFNVQLNNLSESDFKFEKTIKKVEITMSQELLDLLQKDGYAKEVVVGTNTSSTEIKRWSTKGKLWGNDVTLNYCEENATLKNEFPLIKKKLNWIDQNKAVIENKIAADLCKLKNDAWLNDQRKMTETEFISNLQLIELEYYEGNAMSLIFSKNGMFQNHEIEINLDENNQLDEAELYG
jgi:hypothetical protein